MLRPFRNLSETRWAYLLSRHIHLGFCHLAAAIVTKFFTRCFPLTRKEIGQQTRLQAAKHDSDHVAVAMFHPSLFTTQQILH